MHFDLKLWRMTSGLRSRIALSAALGLLALAVGIARFAFLGQFLAGVFRGETLILPLLAAAAAILLAWFDHRRSRRTASASRHRHAAFKSFGEEFLDAVQGLPTLKAFGQSAAYGRMLATKARALSDSTFWALSLNVLTRAFTDLGTAFGSAAALALGAYRVRHGEMSIEALLIVLVAGTEIFRPLRDLRAVLDQGLNGQAAANGINALLDAEAPHADGTRSDALTPEIVFDSVAFAYPGGRRSAHAGLSFGIGAGERVGIVGPSGSGKSTIVRLLSRLYEPQGGSIRIGGRNLASLDPAQVRDMIAVVSQDTYLFHGSVEDNLRLGRPDATGADLIARRHRGQCPWLHCGTAAGLSDRYRRARHPAFRRPAAAPGHRPRCAARLADIDTG
jgi:ATP-binding cassette subfamily C protein CydCD